MKRFLALALALTMVFALAACNNGTDSGSVTQSGDGAATTPGAGASTNPGDSGTSAGGFELTVNLSSEPATIDPALNSAVDGAVMLNHFFEGLIKLGPVENGEEMKGAEFIPGQAESWDIADNPDGTQVWTFHLRDGITWSDGQPVTAGDFVYAWQRLVTPDTAADYAYMLDVVVNANDIMEGTKQPSELGVKALDDKTFEVTLITNVPYFTDIAGFPACFPVRKDVIESAGDQWTFDPATYIGNGPYKLQSWNHSEQIVAVKNDKHYDYANLGPDTITFKLIDDQSAMLNGFQTGELDYIEDLPIAEIPALLDSGALKVVPYLGTYYVEFQTTLAPFDNPKVREAFNLVIDRTFIVKNITQTGQLPASGFVPSGIYDAGQAGDFREVGGDYYSIADADYEANCEKARALLAEAGFAGGAGFPTVEYLYNTSDAHKAVGEALQNMWQTELGVTVQLQNEEWNTFLETRKQGRFSICRGGWIADYNDAVNFLDMFVTGGGNNDPQYANPDFDALIRQIKAESDPAKRTAALHSAEDMLLGRDWVVAPIYFYTNKYMLKPGISNFYHSAMGYTIFSYAKQG
ncbi:MAG: peptide ABC transporter substrate-binding protein [Oscillospiraceae bacterium]|jgi:oligopeptide transport system substrate-binding protein|nr:peptide ABC transporter substrate-binding protein [Oscillospiraceae bacterium]